MSPLNSDIRIIKARGKECAPVAQLDRANDFESLGREFEPLRARQIQADIGELISKVRRYGTRQTAIAAIPAVELPYRAFKFLRPEVRPKAGRKQQFGIGAFP